MDTLAKQELAEANAYLAEFNRAHQAYQFFMGYSLVCAAALPVLVLVNWLLETSALLRGSLLGLGFVVFWFAICFYWRSRAHKAFRSMRSRCLKLQNAGYSLYKKSEAFRKILDIEPDATRPDREVLDFERIDPWKLYDKMI